MAIAVAVVGLGRRGREWIATLRSVPGYELVACVEARPETLRDAAIRLQLSPAICYAGLDEALDRARPKAVIVATSIDRHADPCRAALARGIGVLVEKPFALSLREAREIVAEAEAARIPLLVGQNYRYMRMPQTVRRLIADGALGRVGMLTCQTYRSQKEQSPALATLQNSILWEIGVHHLDALRYVLGQRAASVVAQTFTQPWSDAPPGASMQVMIEFEAGVRASYTATYDSRGHESFERGQEFYMRVMTERGALHVFHRWLVWCERGRWPRLVRRGPRAHPEEVTLLAQLERALMTGTAPECSGRDNLETMAILEACARSAAEGRRVDARALFDEPL